MTPGFGLFPLRLDALSLPIQNRSRVHPPLIPVKVVHNSLAHIKGSNIAGKQLDRVPHLARLFHSRINPREKVSPQRLGSDPCFNFQNTFAQCCAIKAAENISTRRIMPKLPK
ncbi:MAG: hypothetical protein ACOYVH_08530, partial [Spirochaetota bacterium]